MRQQCSVCSHPETDAITFALMHKAKPWKVIVKEYGITHASLGRHRQHIVKSAGIIKPAKPHALLQTQGAVAALLGGNQTQADIRGLRARAESLGLQAEATGDVRTALLAVRELTRLVELQSRLTIEAAAGRASDVANHPVWHEVNALILDALAPYPDARHAVIDAVSRRLGLPVPLPASGVTLERE